MIRFTKEIEIEASSSTIWNVMSDVETWNEWTPTITRIQKVNRNDLAVGTRLLIEQPKLPKAIWTVVTVSPGASFFMKKGNPFLQVVAGHVIKERQRGAIVTLSLEFLGLFAKPVAKRYKDMMEGYLATEAAGLRQASEGLLLHTESQVNKNYTIGTQFYDQQ
jgi:ribosome-associated toxin RatA of RatAB toxin-antitoxin module